MITLILYFLITVLLNIFRYFDLLYILHNKIRVDFIMNNIRLIYNSMQLSMYEHFLLYLNNFKCQGHKTLRRE